MSTSLNANQEKRSHFWEHLGFPVKLSPTFLLFLSDDSQAEISHFRQADPFDCSATRLEGVFALFSLVRQPAKVCLY